jgi:phage tail sheath protein FI
MANFLHGIETKEFRNGPTPVSVVKTAVVAVIGTAPMGAINQPILCLTDKDHAQFGPELPGFTIPQQLRAIRDHKAGTVIVINVLNPATHTDDVADEVVAFNANTGLAQLAHGVISTLVLKNAGGTVTYVLGTDYEVVDAVKGIIKKKTGGAIPALAAKANYNFADTTAVIAADIIGTTDVAGIRTGMEALKGTYTLFGLKAKIITSPGFSTLNTVRTAMDAMAQQLRAIALADAPIGTTVAQAITGRGPSGAINFNTSSGRMVLLYPHLKVYDPITDSIRLEPYSSRFAALMCLNDVTNGYWASPSNQEIQGIVGVERAITAEYNDPLCEANLLNEVGITTIMNTFGSGIRTWGNRTAAFPSDTHPLNFLAARRTADVIEDSIEMASAKFADKPGNKPNITTVVETAYEFIRTLIQRGATLDGKVWFDAAENPSVQLAAGNYVYCYDFCPPTPMERITWKAYINQNYLAQLAASLAN